jgi:glucans biosynthesis protein C
MADDRNRPSVGPRLPVSPNLDSVRGLACLMVVALHVVGDASNNGLRLPMTSGWHYAMQSIEFLRIPLFTALSGYLYAGRRVVQPELAGFWRKKLRRLGIPLVFATCVLWWLRRYTPEPQTSLLHDLLFDSSHLWYLQALLILFTVVSISDAFFRPNTVALALMGLVAIMVSQSAIPVTPFFSLGGAFYLAPYFLFGIILREHPDWLRDPQSGILALGIIVIVLASQQIGLFHLAIEVTTLQMPAAMAGMAGVVFFLQRFPQSQWLARIGVYSYTIYLWHVVANAAVRTILVRLDITDSPTLFIAGFIAAVTVPIIMYHVARRIPLISLGITGEHRLPLNARALIQRRTA